MFRETVRWLGARYNVMVMLLVLTAGLISYYVDRRQMETRQLAREAAWARSIGLTYMIGGTVFWLALQITMRILGLR